MASVVFPTDVCDFVFCSIGVESPMPEKKEKCLLWDSNSGRVCWVDNHLGKDRLRKLNLGHLDYLKIMGPSQGSILASPESTSIAPDFDRAARLRGSPASSAFYSSAHRYCFSIFAHYCRYYLTFPLHGWCSCARSYYRVATIFMCANTLLWAGAGAVLLLLIFCARSVPA
jgi:hypothetical protein